MKVEHEYERLGAWAYVAALDVHRPRLFGRCEAKSGIAPFDRLVAQLMTQDRWRSRKLTHLCSREVTHLVEGLKDFLSKQEAVKAENPCRSSTAEGRSDTTRALK